MVRVCEPVGVARGGPQHEYAAMSQIHLTCLWGSLPADLVAKSDGSREQL